ncbi:hypothetical protein BJ944DRAFT_262994 [Cunninghamella echinulata]|nr:hypothetical protein BJ944DRAFT_262994 [Cunninghamella echinulata]
MTQKALLVEHLPKTIQVEQYLNQQRYLPSSGNALLAQFDNTSVVVYIAVSKSIANFAVEHQTLSGVDSGFKLNRASWIKPSFLFMNQRSWWNTKDTHQVGDDYAKQSRTLAIRIRRDIFDYWINHATTNAYPPSQQYIYRDGDEGMGGVNEDSVSTMTDIEKWKQDKLKANITYQWVPDRLPCLPLNGKQIHQKLSRNVIQFLLRGPVLSWFASSETILSIEDITPFIEEIRSRLVQLDKNMNVLQWNEAMKDIWVPSERVYAPLSYPEF